MIKFLFKDMFFNLKPITIAIGLVLFFYFYVSKSFSTELISSIIIIMPIIFFSFIVGKACYNEEKNYEYRFFKTLPIKLKSIVLSRYIFSFICLFFSYFLIFILDLISNQHVFIKNSLILVNCSTSLIYMAVYLIIFFKYNYSLTQIAGYVAGIFSIGIITFQKYISSILSSYYISLYIIPCVSLLILIITFYSSVKALSLRE